MSMTLRGFSLGLANISAHSNACCGEKTLLPILNCSKELLSATPFIKISKEGPPMLNIKDLFDHAFLAINIQKKNKTHRLLLISKYFNDVFCVRYFTKGNTVCSVAMPFQEIFNLSRDKFWSKPRQSFLVPTMSLKYVKNASNWEVNKHKRVLMSKPNCFTKGIE